MRLQENRGGRVINIKEITRRAGVSSAMTSRVLNNSGYVKEGTRQKVFKTADEYNYVPSAIARSLSIQDSLNVGTIIPDIENEFFSKVMSGISGVAESYHHDIVLLGTNETLEKEHDSLKIVEGQRLKDVVITPISETNTVTRGYLLRLEEFGIPMVLVDRDVKGTQFGGAFVDNQRGSYDGVVALVKAGHERIAIIIGPKTSKPGKDRHQGYLQAVESDGLSVPEEYVACGDFKIVKTYEYTGRLLGLEESPVAIFTSDNLSTLGYLKYLTEHKIRIGGDISLMGFDDIDTLRMTDYRISVVNRDAREQGRETMRFLQECLEDSGKNHQRGRRITIPHKVILRGSERRKTT